MKNNFNKFDKTLLTGHIAKIVREKFCCKIVALKKIGEGGVGTVYRAELENAGIYPEIVVLKAYKISGMHKTEALELITLRQHSTMKFPEVYFTFDADEQMPVDFLCMEFLEGVNAFTHFAFLLKSKKKKRAFAEKVVESMLKIHSFTNEKFGTLDNAVYEKWLDYYRPYATEVLRLARQLYERKMLANPIFAAMEAAFGYFDEIFSEEVREASLIHGDLNVMNILTDKKSMTPVAFIDPMGAKFADREYDLFQLNNLTGKLFGIYDVYKERYKVSEKCDIKVAFYGLYHEVDHYIKSGNLFGFIMNPLVRNMNKQLSRLKNAAASCVR